MSTSTIEDEGKAIAEALGVIYTGPQYHKGELYCHLFTDPLTGSTFAATNKGNAWARFFALREEFGAPLPDNIPPEWKDFTLKFRGNLAKAFKEMGWLPARAGPIIHEATSINPDPTEFMPVEVYTPEQEAADRSVEYTRMVQEQGIDTTVKYLFVDAMWLEKSAYYRHPFNRIEMFRTYPALNRELDLAILSHEAGHADLELAGPAPENELLREVEAYRRGRRLAVAWGVEDRFNELAKNFVKDTLEGRPFERPVTVASLEDARPELERLLAELEGGGSSGNPHLQASTHPLVLERFPYPAPEYMDLGGEIGELKVKIPPPRGAKLDEGSVIRTSEKHDKAVEHLGYHSVSLTDKEIASLETRVLTDIELINESQDRLRKTKVIQDEQLSPLQLAHLNLARAIAEETDCVPPGGIYAAVIPPASDKVRTTGLYGTRTGTLYLSIEMLPKGRNAIDTLVHELGHHLQFSSTGEAEDLTPSHAGAMKSIAEKLTQGLNSGDYDKLLVTIQY